MISVSCHFELADKLDFSCFMKPMLQNSRREKYPRIIIFFNLCLAVTECQVECVGCLKWKKIAEACVCDWPFLHGVLMTFP